jgi:hypothetical protein
MQQILSQFYLAMGVIILLLLRMWFTKKHEKKDQDDK